MNLKQKPTQLLLTEAGPTERLQMARDKIRFALNPDLIQVIKKKYEEALQANDYFDAMDLRDKAEKWSLDLSEIERSTPTTIDLEALKKGEIPLAAVS